MTFKERERAFYIGVPLAVVPALSFLPAVMFLVVVPKVAHGQAVAFVVLPLLAAASGVGLWKLAFGAVQRPFGILNALSFAALFVLMVIAGYTGLFLALIAVKF